MPNLAKTAANTMPATNGYIKNGMNGKKRSMLGKTQTIEIDDPVLETPNVNHLQVSEKTNFRDPCLKLSQLCILLKSN